MNHPCFVITRAIKEDSTRVTILKCRYKENKFAATYKKALSYGRLEIRTIHIIKTKKFGSSKDDHTIIDEVIYDIEPIKNNLRQIINNKRSIFEEDRKGNFWLAKTTKTFIKEIPFPCEINKQ